MTEDDKISVERPRDAILSRVIHTWLAHEMTVRVTAKSRLTVRPDGRGAWIFANHLSFLDAHVIEKAVWESGLMNDVWACAGPKVHDGFRAAFADSVNIIQVPQPVSVTGSRDLRGMARHAQESIRTARAKVEAGGLVIVFPEGTRTRTGQMNDWHKGVARYLKAGDWIIPTYLKGTEVLGGCVGGQEYAEFADARGSKALAEVTFMAPVEVQGTSSGNWVGLETAREAVVQAM